MDIRPSTPPVMSSADTQVSGEQKAEQKEVPSNIGGTDTLKSVSPDENKMPERGAGDGGPSGDSISEKSIKGAETDTQMSQKGAGDLEKSGSDSTSAEAPISKEGDEKELKTVTDKVQTIQTGDNSEVTETPEATTEPPELEKHDPEATETSGAAAEPPNLEKNDSLEAAGDNTNADESSEPEVKERIDSKSEEGKKEEEG
ncbi:hypothetical protein [Endozoicomonas atrinae]|uniref:hypothetical protein n=1 Tax=Endozoicomonas atrinae TaxID=1333660 RepID=UPI003B002D91